MTDYIKTSQVIQEFLDKNDIKIEVDEFAPVVVHAASRRDGRFLIQANGEGSYGRICAYFGPGGADNCLKALRGLEEAGVGHLCWDCSTPTFARPNEPGRPYRITPGYGKTDGIALHDLLYKIATEEKK